MPKFKFQIEVDTDQPVTAESAGKALQTMLAIGKDDAQRTLQQSRDDGDDDGDVDAASVAAALTVTSVRAEPPPPPHTVDATWLWCKLMDWCKKKGLAPATQNDLFAIVKEARATQHPVTNIEPRVLVVVSGGVAEAVHETGVDVEIFDWDNYRDDPKATGGVPAHFADIATSLGIPVEAEAITNTEHESAGWPMNWPGADRWTFDRGAMPGEPFAFLDGDSESAVAAMVEVQSPARPPAFEVRSEGGCLLVVADHASAAAQQAQELVERLGDALPNLGMLWWNAENAAEAEEWKQKYAPKGCLVFASPDGEGENDIHRVLLTLERGKAAEILGYPVRDHEWLDLDNISQQKSRPRQQ